MSASQRSEINQTPSFRLSVRLYWGPCGHDVRLLDERGRMLPVHPPSVIGYVQYRRNAGLDRHTSWIHGIGRVFRSDDVISELTNSMRAFHWSRSVRYKYRHSVSISHSRRPSSDPPRKKRLLGCQHLPFQPSMPCHPSTFQFLPWCVLIFSILRWRRVLTSSRHYLIRDEAVCSSFIVSPSWTLGCVIGGIYSDSSKYQYHAVVSISCSYALHSRWWWRCECEWGSSDKDSRNATLCFDIPWRRTFQCQHSTGDIWISLGNRWFLVHSWQGHQASPSDCLGTIPKGYCIDFDSIPMGVSRGMRNAVLLNWIGFLLSCVCVSINQLTWLDLTWRSVILQRLCRHMSLFCLLRRLQRLSNKIRSSRGETILKLGARNRASYLSQLPLGTLF